MTEAGRRRQRGVAMAGLVFAVLFWAVNAVVAKGVVDHVPPLALSFYRWVAALAFLLPFACKGIIKEKQVIKKQIWVLLLLSIPSVAVYNSFLYLGAVYTTATNISLVSAAMPAATLGVAWLITKEKPKPVQGLGILLALAGVVIIVAKGNTGIFCRLDLNPGDIIMVGAIASWALYSVYYKKLGLPISPIPFLFMTSMLGTLSILPFYLWELTCCGGFGVSVSVFGTFVYLGIFPSIFSYILWNHGVQVLGASTASVSVYLIPVFTSAIAYVYLGEQLFGYHLAGGAMILTGLVFSTREKN